MRIFWVWEVIIRGSSDNRAKGICLGADRGTINPRKKDVIKINMFRGYISRADSTAGLRRGVKKSNSTRAMNTEQVKTQIVDA